MPRFMLPRMLFAVLGVALVAPAMARADGKVFYTVDGSANIPDQVAMIDYRDGVETLVIETHFEGTGSGFAWVVPTPGVPEVFEVSPGTLTTLRAVAAPNVAKPIDGPYAFGLGLLLVLLAAGAGMKRRWVRALWVIVVIAVVGVLFSPALGKARGGGGVDAIEVHERTRIGRADVAVISGPDGGALCAWLEGNGFVVEARTREVIDAYAREGWSFAAARLLDPTEGVMGDANADGSAAPLTRASVAVDGVPRALGLRFAAREAVYPLRLTAVGSEELRVELYVFGAERAGARGFRVDRCARPSNAMGEDGGSLWKPRGVAIVHEGLRGLVDGASVMTKLVGTLSPERMSRDATIGWSAFEESGGLVYAGEDANTRAATLAMVLGIIGIVVMLIVTDARLESASQRGRGVLLVLVISAAVGLGWRATMDVRPVVARTRVIDNRSMDLSTVMWDIHVWWEQERSLTGVPLTIEELRAAITRAIRELEHPRSRGFPIEEDSPGNYTVHEVGERFEVRLYDAVGRVYYTFGMPEFSEWSLNGP